MSTQSQILSWMRESLDKFIAELSLSKSAPTVDAYRYDVAKFLEWLNGNSVKRISSMRASHVVDYLGYCKKSGKSDASVNRYYMAIRAYCRFLRRTKKIDIDLTEDVTPPRFSSKAPYVPSIEEIDKLLAAPNLETESGVRDLAILELLYSSGLRASELCDLQLEDFKDSGIVVKCGKRGKARTVPITLEAKGAILHYIEKHRGKKAGNLFQTKQRKKIRRQLLCAIVMGYAKQVGIDSVTTHTLRHACATHLLDEGADLRLIQEVLGHSSIASTQRYTHLSSSKMRDMFNQFHPRKNKE